MGNFFFKSPLAWAITLRALALWGLGRSGWREDLRAVLGMAVEVQGGTRAGVTFYGYAVPVMNGAVMPDATALAHTTDALRTAERSGDDVSLAWARISDGIMLIRLHDGVAAAGVDLLMTGRQQAIQHGDLLVGTLAGIRPPRQPSSTSYAAAKPTCWVRRRRCLWNRCYAGERCKTCRRRKQRSTGSPPARRRRDLCSMSSRYCGCSRSWRAPTPMRLPTGNSRGAIARGDIPWFRRTHCDCRGDDMTNPAAWTACDWGPTCRKELPCCR
jgi:hypothetical protein